MLTLSREEQRALDKYLVEDCGIDLFLLMEGAAHSICRFILDKFPKDKHIVIFAGAGNNGGDAYALARLLLAFYNNVDIYETKAARQNCNENKDTASSKNRQLLKNLNISIDLAEHYKIENDCLIVDGILGTGFESSRGLSDELADLFDKIKRSRERNCTVISIDIPSGVDANTGYADLAIQADYTVSFVYPKRGLSSYPGKSLAGEIIIGNLAVPKSAINKFLNNYPEYLVRICDFDFVKKHAVMRPKEGHKGLFGKTLIIAGNKSMPGAAMLATNSCLKSGVGLLKLFSFESVCQRVNSAWPEAITISRIECSMDSEDSDSSNSQVGTKDYSGDKQGETSLAESLYLSSRNSSVKLNRNHKVENLIKVKSLIEEADACLIGPGLGNDEEAPEWISYAIKNAKTLILDADALNIIAKNKDYYKELCRQRTKDYLMPVILTPHPGEFARLAPELQDKSRMEQAIEMSKDWSVILVLKGAATLTAICQNNQEIRLFSNSSGNNGLSKGGAGDVLAGLILGLLAQRKNEAEVVAMAAFIHGYAADLALEKMNSRTVLPSDVIENFSEAFNNLNWK